MDIVKKIQLCCAAFGAAAACAGEIDWQSWTAYANEKLTAQTALVLTADEAIPQVGGKKLSGKVITVAAPSVDLNEVMGKKPKAENKTLLVKVVDSPEACVVKLGVGVDWWFEVYCNGKICGGTLRSGGNIGYPPSVSDHTVAVPLKKGKNVVALLAKSGSIGKFTFAVAKMADDTPAERISRRNEIEAHLPSNRALRHGPWLIAPSAGTVTVGFLTDGWVYGAGVEYRKAGSKKFLRKWDTLGGVVRGDSDMHRITLKDLTPGAEYEYRVILAWENKKFQALDTYKFTAPPADERQFSFFATGDTQFSAGRRGKILRNWQKLTETVDFQISLGDLSNIFDDYDEMIFGGYLDWQTPDMYHGKPFVALRGNHEMRGVERDRYFSLLSADRERGYHAFTYGKTFFIVLDTGGDGTDIRKNSMTAEATAEYMSEQRKWVEKLVESSEYKAAKYRIVLSHDAPHSHRVAQISDIARYISEALVKASHSPDKRIHLWLSGHIHRYRRTVPATTAAYGNAVVDPSDVADGKNYPFTILTVEGPGKNSPLDASATIVKVDSEGIEVKSYDEKSRCFDHFLIAPDGRVTEKDNPYKKEMIKLYQ